VVKCFDEEMGTFEHDDLQTLSRKKRNYVTRFNKLAESAQINHVIAMILKSHELFLEKFHVNI
jgi:hypothetical protein